jgi:diguanylate cyclase (GGDEF)-like protein
MQDAPAASSTPSGLAILSEFWRLDEPSRALVRELCSLVLPRLRGIEAEFDEVLLADPKAGALLTDISLRHPETERLTMLFFGAFRDEAVLATAERAAELGRHHSDLGLEGRTLCAAAARVLLRANEAILGYRPDPTAALDAVNRLVFFCLDAAVEGLHARDAERAAGTVGGAEAEALHEQIQALEEMARVDPLTKLFNRRHFDRALEAEVSRAHRYGLPLSLIMADVDFFKRINDSYGHLIGDEVLCHVAEVLQSGARRSDMLARYGGEEFVIILTSTPGDNAELVAERVRQSLEQRPVAFADGHMLRVTISLGFAALGEGDTPKDLIERADAALYRAKQAGRNCVSG